MTKKAASKYTGSILMLSTHGYVAAHPQLGLPDTGGQVVFVLELAKQFNRMGYRVDVVTRQFQDQPEMDQMTEGLRVLRIGFGGSEFLRKEDMHDYIGEFVENFQAFIRRHRLKYDVIDSHYWDAGVAGQQIAERLSIPHIHTPHSLGWWKQKTMRDAGKAVDMDYRFPERISREKWIYRSCDHIIATTNQQVEILKDAYRIADERITMIPPGIDERRFTPPIDREERTRLHRTLGFRPHDVYAVGRVAPNKGYDLLIRCLPHLRRLVADARVILAVGADAEMDRRRVARLREVADEEGVSRSVSFRGYVADDELANHYRAASVFALCSRYEPFGMTAVEAMACGTPTVITVHGGLHELVEFGVHALFADPSRPQEFAAALAMPMLYPQLRRHLSIHGSRFAHQEFGWTGIARRTLSVFGRFASYHHPVRHGTSKKDE